MESRSLVPPRLGWWLIAIGATMTSLIFATPYLSLNAVVSRIPLNPLFDSHFYWLALHAGPSGLALLIGPLQFLSVIRARWPAIHRTAGRIYLACVLIGSLAAVSAAMMTTAGFSVQVGFILLVMAWLYSGSMGYRTARSRQFSAHRVWMIRNYALTFAAVLLRIFLLSGLVLRRAVPSIPYDQIYAASVWGSILVSSLVAEWFIASPRGRDNHRPDTGGNRR